MVFDPFQHPNTQGRLPRHVEGLTPGMISVQGNGLHEVQRPLHQHVESLPRRMTSVPNDRLRTRIDPFPMGTRMVAGTTTNEEICIGRSDGLESVSNDKISVNIPCLEQKRLRWCEEVQNLKSGSKPTEDPLKVSKPFGTSYQGAKSAEPPSKGSTPFGKFKREKKSVQSPPKESIGELGNQEERETPKPYSASLIRSPRRVRFQVAFSAKNRLAPDVMDISNSTSSTMASSVGKKPVATISLGKSISNHRCPPIKNKMVKKSNFERLYWSHNEMKQTIREAQQSAESFRTKNPVSAKQVARLFEDFCSNNNKVEKGEEDEDNEEILREFLQDWAASEVRGLEENVTGRNMFSETKKMGIGSVLAYQESLREQQKEALGRSSGRTHTLYDSANRMAEQLRARSESTSQRARMFAMYMALGDALAANDEFSYD